MRVFFVCPFNLKRLTGTPIRTVSTINAVSRFSDVSVATTGGEILNNAVRFYTTEKVGILRFSRQVLGLLTKERPDVVHGVSTLSVIPILFYRLFLNRKSKMIFEIHGWSWFESKKFVSLLKRFVFLMLDMLGFVFSDKVISMSFTQKDFLQKILFKKRDVEVIWGPVDFEVKFKELPKREIFKVGYLGNDSFWQGIESIVGAAKLLEQNKKIFFYLAGFEAKDNDRFPKTENIQYVGKLARTEITSFICDMDVMVSPRIKGKVSDLQYPQKLSEYLACGRPVIVSDTNDQKIIINKAKCGIVLNEVTHLSLKSAIEDIYSLSLEEKNLMGKNASIFADEHFSFEVFANKIRKIYKSLQPQN
ncbi:MAG: glycosyltransferase family 4 protein [Parcubacteria group bacterium]|nr:glycosyltransferase family 4 protein [Parcubacteria group bacterium]